MTTVTSQSVEDKALKLLGSGVDPERCAIALGVSVSRISQLINDPDFSAKVADLRFNTLTKLNEIDASYEDMEIKLQEKLRDMIQWMSRPAEVLAAIRIINGTQRRGVSTPTLTEEQKQVVQLNIPVIVAQQFVTNINNQVIKAGDTELVTVQSGRMKELLENSAVKRLSNVQSTDSRTTRSN